MCSSARRPSGSRKLCGGEPGRADRCAEGRARCPGGGFVSGAGRVAGMVFQVAQGRRIPASETAGGIGCDDRLPVRETQRDLWVAADHRGPARTGVAGEPEHRGDADGRARFGGSPQTQTARHDRTRQVRAQGARRVAPRFQPAAAAGRALVWGSHRDPHRRRQTAESPRCWTCIRVGCWPARPRSTPTPAWPATRSRWPPRCAVDVAPSMV